MSEQIPGIAAIGPTLNPNLNAAFGVKGDLDFTGGFEVTVRFCSTLRNDS